MLNTDFESVSTSSADPASSQEIVPSLSIEHLLQQRSAVMERIERALSVLSEAQAMAAAAHLGFPKIAGDTDYRRGAQPFLGDAEDRARAQRLCQRIVDAQGWKHLLSESGMQSLMSASKRTAFRREVDGDDVPELTLEAICGTFGALHEARGEMFEQGVIECFRRLSWRYKTNLPQKFGKRIIITRLVTLYGVDYDTASHLDDLLRVFHVLEGKPEPDHRQGSYILLEQAMRAQGSWPKPVAHAYYKAQLFMSGNAHLTFTRPDLIERVNGILAKHYPNALPEPR